MHIPAPTLWTADGFDREAIRAHAREYVTAWAEARETGARGWTARTVDTDFEDRTLAIQRAWRVAKAQRQAASDAAYWEARTANATPEQAKAREADLLQAVNSVTLQAGYDAIHTFSRVAVPSDETADEGRAAA